MSKTLPVDSIVVGERYRKDIGDIDALAASIAELGLLHPPVVREDNVLIVGARRLAAVKKLGWENIPVRVAADFDDTLRFLRAERDENTCRKDLLPSEALDIAEVIEPLERKAAKKRKSEATAQNNRNRNKKTADNSEDRSSATEKSTENPSSAESAELENGQRAEPQSRAKTAEAVGMSHDTLRKAQEVRAAAKADPDKFGDLPDKMDSTSVNAAHSEMKRRQKPPKPPLAHPYSDEMSMWLDRVAGQTFFDDIERGGLGAMLLERKKWDWKKVKNHILPLLDELAKTINGYRRELRNATSK